MQKIQLNPHEVNLIAKYDQEIQTMSLNLQALVQQRIGVLQTLVCSRGAEGTWALAGDTMIKQESPVSAN